MVTGRRRQRNIRLMVVEDDPGVGYAVSRWLQEQEVRSVLATSTSEAMEMLRDIIFIEAAFDALLVDYNLPDSTGVRVIQEFRDEFPTVPVALMTGNQDESLEVWTRERQIPLFRKPLKMDQVSEWIEGIRQTA